MASIKLICLSLVLAPGLAKPLAEPNPPVWPETVSVFHPGDARIDPTVAAAYASNGGHTPPNNGQFSEKRFAFLFAPGTYTNDVPVGFYTQVMGLGKSPLDTVFSGTKGVFSEEQDYGLGGALCTFWRSAENFHTTTSFDWKVGTGMMWAVSQAAPLRNVVIDNDLALYEYQPPIPQAGYASGGFMANVMVKGKVQPGSQQQWFTRNSNVGSWNGGVWNMVFAGVAGAPPSHCSNQGGGPFTTVDSSPTVAEKPFITIDGTGKFTLEVPQVKNESVGAELPPRTTSLPFDSVYVTKLTDTASDINAKLGLGLSVVISPGIYKLDAPLVLNHSGQVLLGLGLATLVPTAANTLIAVADGVDNVRVAGLLLQAGPTVNGQNTTALLRWGSGGYKGDASKPGMLADVHVRVGGPDGSSASPVAATVGFEINSGNVIGDNMWLWRADHAEGGPVTYDSNRADHGLVVNGDNVLMYGLATEHFEKDLVVWNGEAGQTFFFQSELPYGVTQEEFGNPGYVGYRVAANVTSHKGYGVGVYSFFRDNPVVVANAISVPDSIVSSFINPLTVWLNGNTGSSIQHIISGKGSTVQASNHVSYYCQSTEFKATVEA